MNSENFKIVVVTRDLVCIEIVDTTEFDGHFNIGSYIKIPYKDGADDYIIGVIENYKVKVAEQRTPEAAVEPPRFVIDVKLIGCYTKNEAGTYVFSRGAHGIPLPPNNGIELLTEADYNNIYSSKVEDAEKFIFSTLVQNPNIKVPVNGNKFFNKHFAIVGSTGSGKSHTLASVLQQAIKEKIAVFDELNNSHVVIFDIHGEYKKAFPDANHINSENIKIPFWLFDSDELGDLFIESNEDNSHNQVSQFRYAVTENKKRTNPFLPQDKIYFDSPLKFDIDEVIRYIKNINDELINKDNARNPTTKTGAIIANRLPAYFETEYEFSKIDAKFVNGPFTGDFERFVLRLETIRHNPRLKFLFDGVGALTLEDVLKEFLGYNKRKIKNASGVETEVEQANITVIDLSGIPFEVLSITVSLISRILFEYGYYYKKYLNGASDCETPLLLVYEEAHKYVPRSDLVKYRASKTAIERIAKEGRKYGVTLGIVSQRPSEISETIFSQCNNFIAMRLTNPDDQNYVKKLLPDTLGDLTSYLPSLQSGEALIIGESIIFPSLVKINFPENEPDSTDIRYLELWKEKWKVDVKFSDITDQWKK
jgi:DNA helicase HerA-like ATPase